MSAPPPPPPPHGENPRSSGLPPGNYDIFIIPPHSSGSGFIYLPSLKPNVNSFAAGFASALIMVAFGAMLAPAVQAWWNGLKGSGGMGMLMVMVAIAIGAWALGRTQNDGGIGGSGPGGMGGEGASHSHSKAHGTAGAGTGAYPGAGTRNGGPPPGSHHAPPPQDKPKSSWHQAPNSPPPGSHHAPQDEPKSSWQQAPNSPPPESQHAPPRDEPKSSWQQEPNPPPPGAQQAPPPPQDKPKSSWQQAPNPPPPEPQHAPPPPQDKPKSSWQQSPNSPPPDAQKPQPPPQEKPKSSWQRPQSSSGATGATGASTPKSGWEKAREETRKRQEEQKAKEAEQKRKEDLEKRLKEAREREAKEREAREKKEQEKKAAEKWAQAKKDMEKRIAEKRELEKKEAEKKAAAEKRGSSYAFTAGEKTNPWPSGRPPAAAAAAAAAPPPPTVPRSAPSTPSPTKRPPAPTAKTYRDTEQSEFSYRPYDKPKRKKSFETMYSESSYAASQSTSRTTPPPSTRGAYSTKDPDKIVIKAVYSFNNAFMRTPTSQLVSGVGSVTDGLILRITTEGLFIDDDVRGVPQREWDVKAWTLKLVEVWCPTFTLSALHSKRSSRPNHMRRLWNIEKEKAAVNEEADALLLELLKTCRDSCRLGGTSSLQSSSYSSDDDTETLSSCSNQTKRADAKQTGENRKGLHLLRANIRDQEGRRYVFVIGQEESWKVAVGLQRLRKGSQVRALGVSGMSAGDTKGILEHLSW